MRALRRNVLRELRQEIEWRENLEIPIRARFEVVGIRVGKGLTSLLLGFVDNLSSIGNLNQPRQTLVGNEPCTVLVAGSLLGPLRIKVRIGRH